MNRWNCGRAILFFKRLFVVLRAGFYFHFLLYPSLYALNSVKGYGFFFSSSHYFYLFTFFPPGKLIIRRGEGRGVVSTFRIQKNCQSRRNRTQPLPCKSNGSRASSMTRTTTAASSISSRSSACRAAGRPRPLELSGRSCKCVYFSACGCCPLELLCLFYCMFFFLVFLV